MGVQWLDPKFQRRTLERFLDLQGAEKAGLSRISMISSELCNSQVIFGLPKPGFRSGIHLEVDLAAGHSPSRGMASRATASQIAES